MQFKIVSFDAVFKMLKIALSKVEVFICRSTFSWI